MGTETATRTKGLIACQANILPGAMNLVLQTLIEVQQVHNLASTDPIVIEIDASSSQLLKVLTKDLSEFTFIL
jgi:hypothetical protein